MGFIENTASSTDRSALNIDLKFLPGISVLISSFQTKSYTYISVFKIVTLEQSLPFAQKNQPESYRPDPQTNLSGKELRLS